jgi:hypothetical protein
VARLHDNTKSFDLLVNDKTVHTIKAGELFYYYPKIETACSINNKGGRVPGEHITPVDSIKFLKFSFTNEDIEILDFHEDLILATRLGLDYKPLIEQAIRNDNEALKKLLTIEKHIDGASAEVFPERYFMVLHFWNDSALAQVIDEDNSGFADNLNRFLLNEFYTGFTKEEINSYMNLFYPKTWRQLKK